MIPLPCPPWTGLGRRLESTVRKALFDFHQLEGVSRLAVAVSGGKDSLTLLFMLHAISGMGFPRYDLVALHAGGEYSCGASVGSPFLSDFCKQMGIKLVSQPVSKGKGQLECYSCSRRRRKLLFEMAKEEGCTTIAFGPHRDDNLDEPAS